MQGLSCRGFSTKLYKCRITSSRLSSCLLNTLSVKEVASSTLVSMKKMHPTWDEWRYFSFLRRPAWQNMKDDRVLVNMKEKQSRCWLSLVSLQCSQLWTQETLRNSLVPSKVRSSKREHSYDLREELFFFLLVGDNDERSLVMGKIFVNAWMNLCGILLTLILTLMCFKKKRLNHGDGTVSAVTMFKGHFVFLTDNQTQEMDPRGTVCKNKTTGCSDPEQFSSVVSHRAQLWSKYVWNPQQFMCLTELNMKLWNIKKEFKFLLDTRLWLTRGPGHLQSPPTPTSAGAGLSGVVELPGHRQDLLGSFAQQ